MVESERLHLCGCHSSNKFSLSPLLVVFSVMVTTDFSGRLCHIPLALDCGFHFFCRWSINAVSMLLCVSR